MFFIVCAIVFVVNYFDNPNKRIDLSEIKDLRISKPDIDLKQTKGWASKKISTTDFEKIKSQATYIMMKPRQIHEKMDYKEMKSNTKQAF